MYFATPAWDQALFETINQSARLGLLDVVMPVLSMAALLWVLVVALLVYGVWKCGRKGLVFFLILASTVALSDTFSNFVKENAGRLRPHNSQAQVHYQERGEWRVREAGYPGEKKFGTSYISSHASNTMALALIVFLLAGELPPAAARERGAARRGGERAPWSPEPRSARTPRFVSPRARLWPLFLLPLLVGYSRIYLGKHFPTDVLGGYLIGICAALVVYACYVLLARSFFLERCEKSAAVE